MLRPSHRLRRAVLHPSLVLKDSTTKQSANGSFVDVEDMIKTFVDANADANAAAAKAESEDTKINGTNAFAEDVLNNLAQEVDDECPICMDVQQSPMIIPGCLHQW